MPLFADIAFSLLMLLMLDVSMLDGAVGADYFDAAAATRLTLRRFAYDYAAALRLRLRACSRYLRCAAPLMLRRHAATLLPAIFRYALCICHCRCFRHYMPLLPAMMLRHCCCAYTLHDAICHYALCHYYAAYAMPLHMPRC